MSAPDNADLREEIRRLHHGKDAAYRDAWKKRGEVISVLANIARKVDRLTDVLDGGHATAEESVRACFAGLATAAPAHARLACAQRLTDTVVCLLMTFR